VSEGRGGKKIKRNHPFLPSLKKGGELIQSLIEKVSIPNQ